MKGTPSSLHQQARLEFPPPASAVSVKVIGSSSTDYPYGVSVQTDEGGVLLLDT